ncbi:MAG: HAD family phosphatase [Phycisphaeraceae bacterium]|nr:HAD family phosphatase [Phycisphaeraceae bacterium]
MIKAMIFDFDGVLVDSEPLHFQAFLDVLGPLGVEFDYDEYLRTYLGFDDRDALTHAVRAHRGDWPESLDLAALCRSKQEAFEAIIARGIDPIPGAEELVARISSVMPVAIASGATRRDIQLILGGLMPDHPFDPIVSADDVEQSKPHPATYQQAAEGLSRRAGGAGPIRPGQIVAIEDTAAGIESARAAGLWTLGVLTTSPRSALHRAHRIIEDYAEVTPEHLARWFGAD